VLFWSVRLGIWYGYWQSDLPASGRSEDRIRKLTKFVASRSQPLLGDASPPVAWRAVLSILIDGGNRGWKAVCKGRTMACAKTAHPSEQ
jgi:hypothetical protein